MLNKTVTSSKMFEWVSDCRLGSWCPSQNQYVRAWRGADGWGSQFQNILNQQNRMTAYDYSSNAGILVNNAMHCKWLFIFHKYCIMLVDPSPYAAKIRQIYQAVGRVRWRKSDPREIRSCFRWGSGAHLLRGFHRRDCAEAKGFCTSFCGRSLATSGWINKSICPCIYIFSRAHMLKEQ